MAENRPRYRTLFLSTLRLSACTFGGGYVIVPLMRKTFVEKLHWIQEEEMMDFTAIAQSTPGAMAVNASILVGYRMAGVPGALVTMGGTILPPLVIISVISLFYEAFRANPIVNLAMTGMLAGVAAVICDVVFTMARSVLRPGKWVLPAVLMVLSFLAVVVLDWNPILVLLLCGGVGALQVLRARRAGKGGEGA